MTIFFTSDQHFWHRRIIEYCDRPYNTVEEMNEALVTNWNNVVTQDDTVYCLGDFSLHIRSVELYTGRLNGTKYLIPGNHDWCHSYNKRSRKGRMDEQIAAYEKEGWIVLPEHYSMEIDGPTVNMCPHPYQGDVPHVPESTEKRHKDKFWNYRMIDDGRWLINGHCHESWSVKNKQINVGVDVWDFAPVSIEKIKEIIK